MSSPLIFKGIAHPPPKSQRQHPSDLDAGELIATEGLNIPIHVEHDTSVPSVGNVLTSYRGTRGELRVCGQIDDPKVAQQVRDGSMRGLSLGTDCVQSMDGRILGRSQRELSVCKEGRRSGTWITDVDNKLVHTVAAFSKKGAPPSTLTYLPPPAPLLLRFFLLAFRSPRPPREKSSPLAPSHNQDLIARIVNEWHLSFAFSPPKNPSLSWRPTPLPLTSQTP